MVSKVNSLGLFGLDAFKIEVEASTETGLPIFEIVGLPDAAVKESRNRVRSAIKNVGLSFPISRITVNLSPADIKKEGSVYDLPILISLLLSSKQINCARLDDVAFVGEVTLSGELKPIRGLLAMALKAKELDINKLFVPFENANEGLIAKDISLYPANNITEIIDHLTGVKKIEFNEKPKIQLEPEFSLDFSQVKGQFKAKRALEIAAAGNHNIVLIGSPGSGKSMLSKRIPTILPKMSYEESIETTKIHSISGNLPKGIGLLVNRPFRSPHHTISAAGLAGGGSVPKPGEISLSHNGVLFLDELPEFSRSAMEILRQPIEDGVITISRVNGTLSYPCSFLLVAAMNPCPCGYFGHPTKKCRCSEFAIKRYLSKISGPLLDRLDLHIEVPPVDYKELAFANIEEEKSGDILKRVEKARSIQSLRYKDLPVKCNAKLNSFLLEKYCNLSNSAEILLEKAFKAMSLSARAYSKLLKISRTIADLEGSEEIKAEHMAEAVQYRSLDRKYWM